jgi:ubiquinone/menaquinone biosynthesis C-methylase UbiE
LELGSGSGFMREYMREYIPGLLTYEYFPCRGVDYVVNGQQLPFGKGTLRGIVITNTFHHFPQPRLFFKESIRCLRPGGSIKGMKDMMIYGLESRPLPSCRTSEIIEKFEIRDLRDRIQNNKDLFQLACMVDGL